MSREEVRIATSGVSSRVDRWEGLVRGAAVNYDDLQLCLRFLVSSPHPTTRLHFSPNLLKTQDRVPRQL